MSQTSTNVTAGNDARASEYNKVVADLAEIYAGGPGVPIGGVIWWLSDGGSIPINYKLCDGSTVSDGDSPLNGVTLPNLIDRFIRGVSNQNLRTSPVSGGADTHTLTISELPPHDHTYYQGRGGVQYSAGFNNSIDSSLGTTGTNTGATGGGQAHNNIPAYRGLVPIIRIK